MAIDGDSFEAEITSALKGQPQKPVEVPEDLEEAWSELSTEQQKAYRRSAEAWWPREKPLKLAQETRATHALRVEAAEVDRQKMLDRDQIKAFKQARTPKKLQVLVDGMAEGLREQSAALRRDKAAKAEEQEQLLDAQRKRAGREGGSGLDGGWRQV